jgi:hypothetical protein
MLLFTSYRPHTPFCLDDDRNAEQPPRPESRFSDGIVSARDPTNTAAALAAFDAEAVKRLDGTWLRSTN